MTKIRIREWVHANICVRDLARTIPFYEMLGFEKFDAIGARRETHKLLFYPNLKGVAARRAKPKEVDLELDTKGRVAGIQGSDFTSPRELGDILARTPQCQECMVKQVFRYMSGRQDTPADRLFMKKASW